MGRKTLGYQRKHGEKNPFHNHRKLEFLIGMISGTQKKDLALSDQFGSKIFHLQIQFHECQDKLLQLVFSTPSRMSLAVIQNFEKGKNIIDDIFLIKSEIPQPSVFELFKDRSF